MRVVDAAGGAPLSGAIISTGAYNLLPDRIVGKTDKNGLYVGTADDFQTEYGIGATDVRAVGEPSYVWVSMNGFVAKCIGLLPQGTSKGAPAWFGFREARYCEVVC